VTTRATAGKMVPERILRKEGRFGLSGTNFIMMTIMILILLFVLVNVGPLLGLYLEPAPAPGG
jgi:uncharacterized protein YqhQ